MTAGRLDALAEGCGAVGLFHVARGRMTDQTDTEILRYAQHDALSEPGDYMTGGASMPR